jgi:hypothetical protein
MSDPDSRPVGGMIPETGFPDMTMKRGPDGVAEPPGHKEKEAGDLVHESRSKLERRSCIHTLFRVGQTKSARKHQVVLMTAPHDPPIRLTLGSRDANRIPSSVQTATMAKIRIHAPDRRQYSSRATRRVASRGVSHWATVVERERSTWGVPWFVRQFSPAIGRR